MESKVKTQATREDKALYCQITLKRFAAEIADRANDLQGRLKKALETGSDRELELILNSCIQIQLHAVEGSDHDNNI